MTSSDHEPLPLWPEAKLDRAWAHHADLKGRIEAWIESDPYRLERMIADDRLSWQLFLRVDNPPPVIEWATIVGDCVHNLRSALDAAVWDLATVDGAVPANPKLVQFPFVEDPRRWRRGAERSLAGLPTDVLPRIEEVQPYNHAKDAKRFSALSLLNTLDIEDKHKAGVMAEIQVTDASSRSQIQFETDEAAARHVRPRQEIQLEMRDGALLHRETTRDPIVDVRGDFDATIMITIETPRGPVTLWALLDKASQAVINTLNHLYGLLEDKSRADDRTADVANAAPERE